MKISNRHYDHEKNTEYFVIKWKVIIPKEIPKDLYNEINEIILKKLEENNL